MSNWKFVVPRTTILTGKPVIYLAATLASVACLLAPFTARAQSASEIYKRMTDVYANAKSYQGTIVRVEKGKTPNGPASQTISIKISFKAPNKYVVENKSSTTVGPKSQSSDHWMVTDGKALFMYSPQQKIYQRGQIRNENMLTRYFAVMNPVDGFALLPETAINGRPTFVLKPNAPTRSTPAQIANAKTVKIAILIDKQTYQFIKMTITGKDGNLVQSVNGQSLNGSVPDSLFKWTPPAGYREIKAPSAPGGGPAIPGNGGAPNRAPGR